jgi:hypothetical protein
MSLARSSSFRWTLIPCWPDSELGEKTHHRRGNRWYVEKVEREVIHPGVGI